MEQHAVLDRIEDGKYAVLLVGDKEQEIVVSINEIPETTEGLWFLVQLDGERIISIVIDQEKTNAVKSRINDKMARLKARKGKRF